MCNWLCGDGEPTPEVQDLADIELRRKIDIAEEASRRAVKMPSAYTHLPTPIFPHPSAYSYVYV